MDPNLLTRVEEYYGEGGLGRMLDVARRAEAGPARPRELEVRATEDPERYPPPPKEIPPLT